VELRERLRHALQPGAEPPLERLTAPVPSSRPLDARLCRALPLRRIETGRGALYLAEEWWPLDYRHGRLALGEALSLNAPGLSRLTPGLSSLDLAAAAFVDVETTGLVGGTGTYVFLVGLGTFEPAGRQGGYGAFRLRQFFLADVPGERVMLAAVAGALIGCRALVSFNGRQFDLPLLETRLTLSRLPALPLGMPHLDLLYPARRLYRRRLPSCRLASLEEALLGLDREDDVPGWAIPALYFDYVHRGEAGPLRAVFRHNALDILSLVALLAHLGQTIGGGPPADLDDCVALARWDESEGRLAEAVQLYEVALDGGADGEGRALALRRLARLYRRLGRWEDAARLWHDEAENGGTAARRLEALIELAKLEEHRRRDYAAAEAVTRRALSLVELLTLRGDGRTIPSLGREVLEHRLWRLRRRLAASQTGPSCR
jgi:uncharacterized protein YprB with RNaseH-like and TPR domain